MKAQVTGRVGEVTRVVLVLHHKRLPVVKVYNTTTVTSHVHVHVDASLCTNATLQRAAYVDNARYTPIVVLLCEADAVTYLDGGALLARRVVDDADAALLDVQQPLQQRAVVTHELKHTHTPHATRGHIRVHVCSKPIERHPVRPSSSPGRPSILASPTSALINIPIGSKARINHN